MNTLNEDTLRWLHQRPFQDNESCFKSAKTQAFTSWDNWTSVGKKIMNLESHLSNILQHDQDSVNRSAAALALGFIGEVEVIKTLIVSLKNDSPNVAMESAISIGKLVTSTIIKPLCDALKHSDANVRASACTALGSIGGVEAISCMKTVKNDENSFVRSAFEEAMQKNRNKIT